MRRMRSVVLAVVAAGFMVAPDPGLAASAPQSGSAMVAASKSCGSFKSSYRYEVTANGGVRCAFAMRIIKSYIRQHSSWRKVGDGTLAGTYHTNRRFKGWRCTQGSGGGGCRKGSRSVFYQSYS